MRTAAGSHKEGVKDPAAWSLRGALHRRGLASPRTLLAKGAPGVWAAERAGACPIARRHARTPRLDEKPNSTHSAVRPDCCDDGFGGRSRARTYDPLIKSQLLYQLSYAPHRARDVGGLAARVKVGRWVGPWPCCAAASAEQGATGMAKEGFRVVRRRTWRKFGANDRRAPAEEGQQARPRAEERRSAARLVRVAPCALEREPPERGVHQLIDGLGESTPAADASAHVPDHEPRADRAHPEKSVRTFRPGARGARLRNMGKVADNPHLYERKPYVIFLPLR